MLREHCGERLRVVVGDDDGLRGNRLGNARGARKGERGQARTGLREEAVGVAVIVARELHDEVAAGVSAGKAHGGHGRLGAGGYQTHALDGGDTARDVLGQLRLSRCARSEREPSGGGSGDGLDHGRMGVAEDRRAPAGDEVHVLAAIGIRHVRPAGRHEEPGRAADRAERAHGRVDAARHRGAGAVEESVVAGEGGCVGHAWASGAVGWALRRRAAISRAQ